MTEEAVAAKIFEYIKKNPDAGDTLEEVAQWWKGIQAIDPDVDRLTLALEKLENEGRIKKLEYGEGVFTFKAA